MVGNKNDLYAHEEVTDKEGIELSKQLNAIYQRTSAKEETGEIDELFKNIGKKLLNPDAEINTHMTREKRKKKGEKLMREQIKNEQNSKNSKKKGCC